jgi:hypothetical protein
MQLPAQIGRNDAFQGAAEKAQHGCRAGQRLFNAARRPQAGRRPFASLCARANNHDFQAQVSRRTSRPSPAEQQQVIGYIEDR